MKIAYGFYRHNPRDISAGSGVDFFTYRALRDEGFDVRLVGPLRSEPALIEKAVRRIVIRFSRKAYAKFPVSTAWRASHLLSQNVRRLGSDLAFSLYPAPFVFYSGPAPCVWFFDTTLLGQERSWPLYGWLARKVFVWEERRAIARCARLVTNSEWSKNVLRDDYGVPPEKIGVVPMPAALPDDAIPPARELPSKGLPPRPLQLLLVGRERMRKGVDTAIEVVHRLNAAGAEAQLTVVGLEGEDSSWVHFAGLYRKDRPHELNEYVSHFARAHLLIHPALFEAAGIVPSEAAAFGTPTITNDTGGLATTVRDGVSGIVLPGGTDAQGYVAAIIALVSNVSRYRMLCETTRQRFDTELHWGVAGKSLAAELRVACEQAVTMVGVAAQRPQGGEEESRR